METLYDSVELYEKLSKITDIDKDTAEYLNKSSYDDILNLKKINVNTGKLFDNYKKENLVKSQITEAFNKLTVENKDIVVDILSKLNYENEENYDAFIEKAITLLSNDYPELRKRGCLLASSMRDHKININGNEYSFSTKILSKVKKNFDNMQFVDICVDKNKKIMISIANLNNEKLLNNKILDEIIKKFKSFIVDATINENIENALLTLCNLICNINIDEDKKSLIHGTVKFIREKLEYNSSMKGAIKIKCEIIIENIKF